LDVCRYISNLVNVADDKQLFSIYTSPIFTIAQAHHIEQQQYADDMQLYVAMSPTSYSNDVNSGVVMGADGERHLLRGGTLRVVKNYVV